MKKSITKFTLIFGILALVFSACSKDEDDTSTTPDPNPTTEVSSYTLEIDGITATELNGGVSACLDGYFIINGTAPDGSPIAINSSKIMVGETRSICSIELLPEDYTACIENGGFSIGGAILMQNYSPISGTATRTASNKISVSGVLINLDAEQHAFTLEATAGTVAPINCE